MDMRRSGAVGGNRLVAHGVEHGMSGSIGDVAGPMLVVSYRKRYFGNNWAHCMQEGMRSLRHWSKGEIELFAAFTSSVNSCNY